MKLSVFDLPKGSSHYVELPSGRCLNVHVAKDGVARWLHVQANSEQWPQIYSDSLVNSKNNVYVFHSVTKGLTSDDIDYLQSHFAA